MSQMNFEAWCQTHPRHEEVRNKMAELIDQHDVDQIHRHIISQAPEGQLKCIRELQDYAYDTACSEIDAAEEKSRDRRANRALAVVFVLILLGIAAYAPMIFFGGIF